MSELFYDIRSGIKFMEALACIVGILCWARLKPNFWKSFPIYLLIITCCEFVAWYMTKNGIKGTKYLYQLFVIPLEFLFFYFLHYKLSNSTNKKIVVTLCLIYLCCFITELIIPKNNNWVWMSLTYTVGNIILVLLCIMCFLALYKKDELIKYKKLPFYWVNIGVLLFYVGTMPYYTLFLSIYKSQVNIMIILAWLSVLLNYIMYTTFIISFLCFKEK